MTTPETPAPPTRAALIHRHLRIGWSALLATLLLGLLLEGLHGFKIGWYLDAANETRRMMWRLAHAHGALISLIHIAFASTLSSLAPRTAASAPDTGRWAAASTALTAALVLLPGGFFLGGVGARGGDPGLGVLVAPLGAGLLVLATGLVVTHLNRQTTPTSATSATSAAPLASEEPGDETT